MSDRGQIIGLKYDSLTRLFHAPNRSLLKPTYYKVKFFKFLRQLSDLSETFVMKAFN